MAAQESGRVDARDEGRSSEQSRESSEESSKRQLTLNGEHPLQTGWSFWLVVVLSKVVFCVPFILHSGSLIYVFAFI